MFDLKSTKFDVEISGDDVCFNVIGYGHGVGLSQCGADSLAKEGKFINAHLMPKAKIEFSKYIAENIDCDYAMMDTSDGIADALLQISEQSGVKIEIDNIPYDKDIEPFDNYMDLVLYGGEDYELVACVPENFDVLNSFTIGKIKEGSGVIYKGKNLCPDKLFNHFE